MVCDANARLPETFINTSTDIVKVRLQTTTQYKSALECATQIFKTEGPAAFYKGTLTPLIGIGACVSFPVQGPL